MANGSSYPIVVLFGLLLGVILLGSARTSPVPPHRENIVLNSDVFSRPEYVEALAKELEKESVAAYKNQEKQISRNDDYEHNKKFYNQRKLESPSDTVIYPAQLIDLSNSKRNFDEIDHSGFSGFNSKRNFDEIDRSGFNGFNRKRNFDEIDRSGFNGFNRKRNFDEIDHSGFSGFNKREFDEIDRSGVPGFAVRPRH